MNVRLAPPRATGHTLAMIATAGKVLPCVLLWGLLAVDGAAAPPRLSAEMVLANVEQRYAAGDVFQAAVRDTVTDASGQTMRTNDGTILFAPPSSLRFDYYERGKRVALTRNVAFDGSTLWDVDHRSRRIEQNPSPTGALAAAIALLTAGNTFATQFQVSLDVSGRHGDETTAVLEITPVQATTAFRQLVVVVDTRTWNVRALVATAANGTTNRFRLYPLKGRRRVATTYFQVQPQALPGYHLVVHQPQGGGSTVGRGAATTIPPAGSVGPPP